MMSNLWMTFADNDPIYLVSILCSVLRLGYVCSVSGDCLTNLKITAKEIRYRVKASIKKRDERAAKFVAKKTFGVFRC